MNALSPNPLTTAYSHCGPADGIWERSIAAVSSIPAKRVSAMEIVLFRMKRYPSLREMTPGGPAAWRCISLLMRARPAALPGFFAKWVWWARGCVALLLRCCILLLTGVGVIECPLRESDTWIGAESLY